MDEVVQDRTGVSPGQDGAGGVDVAAAAAALGLSVEAVRKRIQRKQLAARRVDGRWLVMLDQKPAPHPAPLPLRPSRPGQDSVQDGTTGESRTGLGSPTALPAEVVDELATLRATVTELRTRVDEQRETVTDLRRRMDESEKARRQEFDRFSQLLAAAVVASRQLPEPATASAPRPAAETGSEVQSVLPTGEAHRTPQQRPWWRFW